MASSYAFPTVISGGNCRCCMRRCEKKCWTLLHTEAITTDEKERIKKPSSMATILKHLLMVSAVAEGINNLHSSN